MLQTISHTEPSPVADESVNTRQAARFLGASVTHMERMRAQKVGPRAHRIGRVWRYSVRELERWRASVSAERSSTSDPGRAA